jgi:hypothetical protein
VAIAKSLLVPASWLRKYVLKRLEEAFDESGKDIIDLTEQKNMPSLGKYQIPITVKMSLW